MKALLPILALAILSSTSANANLDQEFEARREASMRPHRAAADQFDVEQAKKLVEEKEGARVVKTEFSTYFGHRLLVVKLSDGRVCKTALDDSIDYQYVYGNVFCH